MHGKTRSREESRGLIRLGCSVNRTDQLFETEQRGIVVFVSFTGRNTVRGPKHVPTASVFTAHKRGKDIGCVTVGARADWSDVIEYSTATPPRRIVVETLAVMRAKVAWPTG